MITATSKSLQSSSAFQGVPAAQLGIHAKLRAAPIKPAASELPGLVDARTGLWFKPANSEFDTAEKLRLIRQERFDMQEAARDVLCHFYDDDPAFKKNGRAKLHRTCDCHQVEIGSGAEVKKSSTTGKAFYGGLAQCGSVWTCPVCGAKISERRGEELREGLQAALDQGLKPHLVTFTAPHSAGDSIESLAKAMGDAMTFFWREWSVKRWKEDRGIVGNIRSFEVRYGVNGWHPHFHLIIFSCDSLLGDTSAMLSHWQRVCLRAGLDKPNQYGLDIQDGSKAGEYICKFGQDGGDVKTAQGTVVSWDMADELSKSGIKRGKLGSLGPFDMLRLLTDRATTKMDKYRFHYLFLDYARAMKGKSQIKWSRGLRALLGVGPAMTDEEIVAIQDDQAKNVIKLDKPEWRAIKKQKRGRVTVLALAEAGGVEAVVRYLLDIQGMPQSWFSRYLQAVQKRTLHRMDDPEFQANSLITEMRDRLRLSVPA